MSHQVFLSIVCVLRQNAETLEDLIKKLASSVTDVVTDYEIVIIDNGSSDNSVEILKRLTQADGLPNLQVFALTKEVESDVASWAGIESSLGDYVAIIDPLIDDVEFLPEMLESAISGADIVLAKNQKDPKFGFFYKCANSIFNTLYKSFNGVNLNEEAPKYRIISKSVINFILQHPQPSLTYRHIPISGGFTRVKKTYSTEPFLKPAHSLWEGVDKGMRMLVSTTKAPMRLVNTLSIFGAFANLIYSSYVILIYLLKEDVAEGWVSLSLQQSGMFFLISVVLFVLGEYILQMASVSNEGPQFHVAQEFTSTVMTRNEKLNVEDVTNPELLTATKKS